MLVENICDNCEEEANLPDCWEVKQQQEEMLLRFCSARCIAYYFDYAL